MKLSLETLSYLRKLSPQARKDFLSYLRDSDENVEKEVSHIDDNDDRYVSDLPTDGLEKLSGDPLGEDEFLSLSPNERIRRFNES